MSVEDLIGETPQTLSDKVKPQDIEDMLQDLEETKKKMEQERLQPVHANSTDEINKLIRKEKDKKHAADQKDDFDSMDRSDRIIRELRQRGKEISDRNKHMETQASTCKNWIDIIRFN